MKKSPKCTACQVANLWFKYEVLVFCHAFIVWVSWSKAMLISLGLNVAYVVLGVILTEYANKNVPGIKPLLGEPMDEVVKNTLFGFIPTLLVAGVIFAISYLIAPPLIHAKQDDEIASLKGEPSPFLAEPRLRPNGTGNRVLLILDVQHNKADKTVSEVSVSIVSIVPLSDSPSKNVEKAIDSCLNKKLMLCDHGENEWRTDINPKATKSFYVLRSNGGKGGSMFISHSCIRHSLTNGTLSFQSSDLIPIPQGEYKAKVLVSGKDVASIFVEFKWFHESGKLIFERID